MNLLRWIPKIEINKPSGPAGADRLVIKINSGAKMSRGKACAQAVHAALMATGSHPGIPVVVLMAKKSEIESMTYVVRDAGLTEVAPGTVTAGATWEMNPRQRTTPEPTVGGEE